MDRIEQNRSHLSVLANCGGKVYKSIISEAENSLLKALTEILVNIAYLNVDLNEQDLEFFYKKSAVIQELIEGKVSKKTKFLDQRRLIQRAIQAVFEHCHRSNEDGDLVSDSESGSDNQETE